jgi:hypothetical protein
MNFQRIDNDPLRTLDIGKRALKKQKIQSLMYKEGFVTQGQLWMGMGNIIDLIKETKDGEYIEIFKEDFLQYFAIPVRKGEKWRWEQLYEIIPQFPNKGVFKVHSNVMEIVAAFAKLS